MWILNKPTVKQKNKILSLRTDLPNKNIPDNFPEFASQLEISTKGTVEKFQLWDYQKEISELAINNSIALVKSRQIGASELFLAIALFLISTRRGFNILIITKSLDDIKSLSDRLERMIKSSNVRLSKDNVQNIAVENGGQIIFRSANSEEPGRGLPSIAIIWFDECAYYDVSTLMAVCSPAMNMVRAGGIFKACVWYTSTPNGNVENNFHDIFDTGNPEGFELYQHCEDTAKGLKDSFNWFRDATGLIKGFCHWLSNPIYRTNPQLLYDQWQQERISDEDRKREYDLDFRTELEAMYFSPRVIDEITRVGIQRDNSEGTILYALDPAFGGEDFCVCHFIEVIPERITTFNVIHTFRFNNLSTKSYTEMIANLINNYFPNGAGIVECNGGGIAYLEALQEKCSNVKWYEAYSTETSKKTDCARLKFTIEQQKLLLDKNNSSTIKELKNFTKKLKAGSGHDDTVTSLALFTRLALLAGLINYEGMIEDE
jgi:hypothetical protein